METQATKAGLATILCNIRGSTVAETEYVQMLLERRVDGMIFISSEAADLRADHSHYARLLGQGARIVFVNGAVDVLDVPHVGVDERAAGQVATQHLLDLGHERIGFVAGPDRFRPDPREGGRARCSRSTRPGVDPDGLVAHAEFGVDGGRAAMRALLAKPEPPTGVICSSDLMAIGALREATAAGLRVPEDVSIVGFDGIEAVRLDRPAADHGRAADPRDRPHRRRDAPQPDLRPGRRDAGRPVPPAAREGGSTAAPA